MQPSRRCFCTIQFEKLLMILHQRYTIVKYVSQRKRYKRKQIKTSKKDKAHIEFTLVHQQPWAMSNPYTCRIFTNTSTNYAIFSSLKPPQAFTLVFFKPLRAPPEYSFEKFYLASPQYSLSVCKL